jgi:hypothetical protein
MTGHILFTYGKVQLGLRSFKNVEIMICTDRLLKSKYGCRTVRIWQMIIDNVVGRMLHSIINTVMMVV